MALWGNFQGLTGETRGGRGLKNSEKRGDVFYGWSLTSFLLCTKISVKKIFPPLLLFQTLRLLLLQNLPTPRFIPDPTFISDPRGSSYSAKNEWRFELTAQRVKGNPQWHTHFGLRVNSDPQDWLLSSGQVETQNLVSKYINYAKWQF